MHLKRIRMPKNWPLARKENKFVIRGVGPHITEFSIPLTILLRDVLKQVNTSNEAKKIIKGGMVIVNNGEIKNEKFSVGLFDRIYIKKLDKAFSLYLTKNGLVIHDIPKEKLSNKPCSVIGKKILKKNKLQLNLYGGLNIITDKKINVRDTVMVDLKDKKIADHLKLAKGSYALITAGNNKGETGRIESVGELVSLNVKDKKINVAKNNVFVIEENEYPK